MPTRPHPLHCPCEKCRREGDAAFARENARIAEASPAGLKRWRERGDYLPEFLRDFHDQKDLFKALQDVVDRANAKNGAHRSLQGAWSDYHIYTIDIFLWVMAAHGYTLQRSRRPFPFSDVREFTGASRRRDLEALKSIFAAQDE